MNKHKENSIDAAFAGALSSKGCWQKGQLVRSKAGRDNGRYYLILAQEDGFCWVADGRKRSVAHPKRKNSRHLQPIQKVAADRLDTANDHRLTDEYVRAAIASLMKSD